MQPPRNTTNFGLRTFSYLGSKLWNDLPAQMKNIDDIEEPGAFKAILINWEGPNFEAPPLSNFYV